MQCTRISASLHTPPRMETGSKAKSLSRTVVAGSIVMTCD